MNGGGEMNRIRRPCFCCKPDCYECFPDLWIARVNAEFAADPGLSDRLERELDEIEAESLTDEDWRRIMEKAWEMIRRDEAAAVLRRQIAEGN